MTDQLSGPVTAPESVRSVTERHHLEEVPLTDPASNSGLLAVFKHRYLLRLMVRREIQARYAGSKVGLLWSYINPAVRFATFYFVFGIILGRGTVPNFAIHLFAGMIVVNFWTDAFNSGTRSIISNKAVVQKMSLPREMFPIASMLVSLYHTGPQLAILIGACLVTGWSPDPMGFVAFALAFGIVLLFGTGMGVMFSAIGVLYRDFTRIVQTFTNMIQFAVPMMYAYTLIAVKFGTGTWHAIYLGNPLAEAVLLMQRLFWFPTITDDDAGYAAQFGFDPAMSANFPPHLMLRGVIILAACALFLAFSQFIFTRLDNKIPERL